MHEELHLILQRAQDGDREAFAELVTRYKHQVYRHAIAMLGDRMEAEDVVQEAFVKVFYSLSKLESAYAFSSWMTRIVSNLCLDRLKKRKITAPVAERYPEEMERIGYNDSHTNMSIEEAMDHLSEEHRAAIALHDIQGYRYEEMAEMLGIPVGTVKSRLFAARLALRKEWKKDD